MVRDADTIESVAKRFHVAADALKSANKLKGRQLVPGKHLVIPTHHGNAIYAEADTKQINRSKNASYVVKNGDTIAKIAKRFNTSPAAIRLANLIDDTSLLEGERLIIPQ